MRKFSVALFCALFFMLFTQQLSAQIRNKNNAPQSVQRCATDEALAQRYRTDPVYRAMIDQRERDFQAWRQAHGNELRGNPELNLLSGPVTIPVIVHVVLPNPDMISEADVDYFIDRLNLDFSGLNPDSTNGTNFYSVRGHSLIRFALARRTPTGGFTNGIERRVGAGAINFGEPQPIKSFATGGLDPWNTSLYYNVWIGTASGLLGIAPEIGTGTAASDGVCINYQAFSNNPCYTIAAFNLARTAVHEIGHNFGLYHTFQGSCTNADMGQLTSAGCTLPGSVLGLADDTPGQSASTSGCPAGNAISGCAGSPNPPGKMYQNYMDYTDDPCYSMFTNTQVERMHWVLENCRAGYLTTNGLTLPAGLPALDAAAIELISPFGTEYTGCTNVVYNTFNCNGAFTPKVRIQNQGTTTLTSVTVQMVLNGTPLPAQTLPVNIPYSKSAVVTLAGANLVNGANIISITVSAPNGGSDANAGNNTITGNGNFSAPPASNLPLAADFVAATFPPLNMTISNPNANNTWVRNNNGNVNAGSAFIDNYNFNLVGQIDDIRTMSLITTGVSDIKVSFDVAHKNFPGFNDRLQVLYSLDCGNTWLPTGYDKAGATLATAGSSTANYTTPAAGDWRAEVINLNLCSSPGSIVLFAFRGICGYGNNVFIDNILIEKVSNILTPTVVSPTCFVPTGDITVNTNAGPARDYSIDNGVTWQASNVFTGLGPGSYNIVVRPQATPLCLDAYAGNPITFFSIPTTSLPIAQDFVGVTFPPSGWNIFNPNANNTWVRRANGNVSVGSAFIDNYNFNTTGQIDDFRTPLIAVGGASIIRVSFDVAHRNFPGLNDRLQLIASLDCGATFAGTGYDKSGAVLATGPSTTSNYTTPTAAEWRREVVSINLCGNTSPNLLLAFRSTNGYGNNIFIDNITVEQVNNILSAPTVVQPTCAAPTGSITVNADLGPTKEYSINNGATWQLSNVFNGLVPGNYTVVARFTATPACVFSYIGNPVVLNALPVPDVTQPANISVCNGAAVAAITFSGSAVPGTVYNWTNNTPSIGLAASGTGNIASFNAVNAGSAPVVATISVTPVSGFCIGAVKTFTITVNPSPGVTCPGNITTLTTTGSCNTIVNYTVVSTGAPVLTYSLSGATTGSGNGTGSGLVFNLGITTVTVTATNPCGTVSCSFTITVNDSQIPAISSQPASQTTCAGNNVTFAVTATNAVGYQWQSWNGVAWTNISGATTSSYALSNVTSSQNATSYRVIVLGLCTNTTSAFATLAVNPLPTVSISSSMPSLLPGQSAVINATSNPLNGNFIWSFNGAVTGVTGPVYGPVTVNDLGVYRVRFTDANGCSANSNNLTIDGTVSGGLWVFPNPNNGVFHVRFYNLSNEQVNVVVFSAAGEKVYQRALTTGNTPYSDIEIDLNHKPAGVYFVQLVDSNGKIKGTKRIIVNL